MDQNGRSTTLESPAQHPFGEDKKLISSKNFILEARKHRTAVNIAKSKTKLKVCRGN